MTQIGLFTRSESGFTGRVAIACDLTFVPRNPPTLRTRPIIAFISATTPVPRSARAGSASAKRLASTFPSSSTIRT